MESGRPLEELQTALRKGTELWKHGRSGKPKVHLFHVTANDTQLTWMSKDNTNRSVKLIDVEEIRAGQETDVFRRHLKKETAHLSFSLIYTLAADGKDGSKGQRSLDLTCIAARDFEYWFHGLTAIWQLVKDSRGKGRARKASSPAAAADQLWKSGLGTQMARTGPLPVDFLGDSTSSLHKGGHGGDRTLIRVTSKDKARKLRARAVATGGTGRGHIPGDCLMWGTGGVTSRMDLTQGDRWPLMQEAREPQLVWNSDHLDVRSVAIARSHAALLTHKGELYTWGAAAGGRLGHGSAGGEGHPRWVRTLWGSVATSVKCSDSATAAISKDGSLYTWGNGAAGNLGYETPGCQFTPRQVLGGLSTVTVTQVACGPFHMAAVSVGGRLFTWGDGFAGKLGHGNMRSAHQPQLVEALAHLEVLHVACGGWHTAAVVRPPGRGATEAQDVGDLAAPSLIAIAAMHGRANGEYGSLFTWGAEFRGVSSELQSSASSLADTNDSLACVSDSLAGASSRSGANPLRNGKHCGALGCGDCEGRLLPTIVEGDLDGMAVRQVAAGSDFTVALTADGHVYQMGKTGGEGKAPWEGSLLPQKVQGGLLLHSVDRLSAGSHHVTVLASSQPPLATGAFLMDFAPSMSRSVSSASLSSFTAIGETLVTSSIQGGSTSAQRTSSSARPSAIANIRKGGGIPAPSSVVLTWGRGKEGQLGNGSRSDSLVPRVVSGNLSGRRILQVASGGCHSMAVCLHELRPGGGTTAWTNGSSAALPPGSLALAAAAASGPSMSEKALKVSIDAAPPGSGLPPQPLHSSGSLHKGGQGQWQQQQQSVSASAVAESRSGQLSSRVGAAARVRRFMRREPGQASTAGGANVPKGAHRAPRRGNSHLGPSAVVAAMNAQRRLSEPGAALKSGRHSTNDIVSIDVWGSVASSVASTPTATSTINMGRYSFFSALGNSQQMHDSSGSPSVSPAVSNASRRQTQAPLSAADSRVAQLEAKVAYLEAQLREQHAARSQELQRSRQLQEDHDEQLQRQQQQQQQQQQVGDGVTGTQTKEARPTHVLSSFSPIVPIPTASPTSAFTQSTSVSHQDSKGEVMPNQPPLSRRDNALEARLPSVRDVLAGTTASQQQAGGRHRYEQQEQDVKNEHSGRRQEQTRWQDEAQHHNQQQLQRERHEVQRLRDPEWRQNRCWQPDHGQAHQDRGNDQMGHLPSEGQSLQKSEKASERSPVRKVRSPSTRRQQVLSLQAGLGPNADPDDDIVNHRPSDPPSYPHPHQRDEGEHLHSRRQHDSARHTKQSSAPTGFTMPVPQNLPPGGANMLTWSGSTFGQTLLQPYHVSGRSIMEQLDECFCSPPNSSPTRHIAVLHARHSQHSQQTRKLIGPGLTQSPPGSESRCIRGAARRSRSIGASPADQSLLVPPHQWLPGSAKGHDTANVIIPLDDASDPSGYLSDSAADSHPAAALSPRTMRQSLLKASRELPRIPHSGWLSQSGARCSPSSNSSHSSNSFHTSPDSGTFSSRHSRESSSVPNASALVDSHIGYHTPSSGRDGSRHNTAGRQGNQHSNGWSEGVRQLSDRTSRREVAGNVGSKAPRASSSAVRAMLTVSDAHDCKTTSTSLRKQNSRGGFHSRTDSLFAGGPLGKTHSLLAAPASDRRRSGNLSGGTAQSTSKMSSVSSATAARDAEQQQSAAKLPAFRVPLTPSSREHAMSGTTPVLAARDEAVSGGRQLHNWNADSMADISIRSNSFVSATSRRTSPGSTLGPSTVESPSIGTWSRQPHPGVIASHGWLDERRISDRFDAVKASSYRAQPSTRSDPTDHLKEHAIRKQAASPRLSVRQDVSGSQSGSVGGLISGTRAASRTRHTPLTLTASQQVQNHVMHRSEDTPVSAEEIPPWLRALRLNNQQQQRRRSLKGTTVVRSSPPADNAAPGVDDAGLRDTVPPPAINPETNVRSRGSGRSRGDATVPLAVDDSTRKRQSDRTSAVTRASLQTSRAASGDETQGAYFAEDRNNEGHTEDTWPLRHFRSQETAEHPNIPNSTLQGGQQTSEQQVVPKPWWHKTDQPFEQQLIEKRDDSTVYLQAGSN